jgi:hypothetical protein
MNIRQSLPEGLKDFIHFDGLVWALAYAPKLEDVPLFIANRPVMLPPPGFTPFTTTALSPEPPKDPLTFKINPLVPVPDEVLAIACTVFPEAKMFLTLFDSSFIVVYGQEVMCHNMVPFMPETFGGLTVDLVNDDFDFSASGDEAETSDISAMGNAESSDTSSVVDGAEPSDTDTKKIVPGNTLFIRGPLYGQESAKTIPTKAFPFIPHIYHGTNARVGLLVRDPADNVVSLTTVSHLPICHNESVRCGEKLLGGSADPGSVVGTEVRFEADGQPVSEYSGY